MIDELVRLSETVRNEEVEAWKASGGRVVAYACAATPAEVLDAAGVLPYRIRALGNGRTDIADSHLARFNCSFCRSCLQLGLDGTYDFLDGIIETNGCDHLRGMFENWQYVKPSAFFHYLKVPHQVTDDAMEYFAEEIRMLRDAVAGEYGRRITDDDLRSAIERQEAVRDRLRKVYEMRRGDPPAFTGAEALSLFLLASAMPPGKYVEMADAAIEERAGSKAVTGYRARLMLGGAATDELELIREIENVGGLIVTDSMCYGARAFFSRVDASGDPVVSLAKTYLGDLLCPRMYEDYGRRRDFMFKEIEEANVQGVVLTHNKFCDVHGVDNVQLRLDLEKRDVPVLHLEKEYGSKADIGRIRTRVQAFLERIGGRS